MNVFQTAFDRGQAPSAAASYEKTGMDHLYRLMAENLPSAAAFVVDATLRYRLAEGKGLAACGLSSKDFEGELVSKLAPPAMRDQIEGDYLAALGGSPFHREHAVGDSYFVTYGEPLRDADGSVYAAIALSYDITEYKRTEDALAKAQLELREAANRKDEFLAMLAHELRNPLAPISSSLHILRRFPDRQMALRCHDVIERQVSHLSRLVDDLLDVSRIATGKVMLNFESVSLCSVLSDAVEVSRPLIDKAGHDFRESFPAAAVCVLGDRTRLAQVFSNLLNNAAKYTPPGGAIELTAQVDGDDAVVRVADNGIGIPEEQLPKVFDLFSQVDSSLNRAQGGLGIGLSLVKALIEMHCGSITANSGGAGRGSCFTVRVPLGTPSCPTTR